MYTCTSCVSSLWPLRVRAILAGAKPGDQLKHVLNPHFGQCRMDSAKLFKISENCSVQNASY